MMRTAKLGITQLRSFECIDMHLISHLETETNWTHTKQVSEAVMLIVKKC